MQEDRATGYGPAGGREQPVAPGASCEVLYVDEAARNADDGQQLSNADPADELQTTDVVSGCFVSLSEKSDLRNAAHQQGHNTTTWALKTVSNATDVGRRLAKLAVEVDESFGPEFDSLLDSIATDDANTSKIDYNAMKVILSRLFSGGLSAIKMYSRILAVLVFGFRYAMRYSDSFALVGLIIHSIVRWMAESEVIAFVKAHGGWIAALAGDNASRLKYYGLAAGVIVVGAILYWKYSSQ